MSSMLNPAISRSRIFELTSEEWALLFAGAGHGLDHDGLAIQHVTLRLAVAHADRRGLTEDKGRQALAGADPHVVAAMRADVQVGRQLAVEDHLPAGRTFDPEILRHLARGRVGGATTPYPRRSRFAIASPRSPDPSTVVITPLRRSMRRMVWLSVSAR